MLALWCSFMVLEVFQEVVRAEPELWCLWNNEAVVVAALTAANEPDSKTHGPGCTTLAGHGEQPSSCLAQCPPLLLLKVMVETSAATVIS